MTIEELTDAIDVITAENERLLRVIGIDQERIDVALAENERLRVAYETECQASDLARVGCIAAEARIAELAALLGRCVPPMNSGEQYWTLITDIRAFLANNGNQPAARTETEPVWDAINKRWTKTLPRTEAERVTFTTVQGQTLSSCTMADVEVLKAWDAVPTTQLHDLARLTASQAVADACAAELARRELK